MLLTSSDSTTKQHIVRPDKPQAARADDGLQGRADADQEEFSALNRKAKKRKLEEPRSTEASAGTMTSQRQTRNKGQRKPPPVESAIGAPLANSSTIGVRTPSKRIPRDTRKPAATKAGKTAGTSDVLWSDDNNNVLVTESKASTVITSSPAAVRRTKVKEVAAVDRAQRKRRRIEQDDTNGGFMQKCLEALGQQ